MLIRRQRTSMMALIVVMSFWCFCAYSQTRQYLYYLNHQMQFVAKEQATIIGKGLKKDSIFSVRFYSIKDDKLLQKALFKDSTLTILHGGYVRYYPNQQMAQKSFYLNNLRYGPSVKWDSLGRTTDSAIYYAGKPTYKIVYAYSSAGDKSTLHEFINKYAAKWPNEKQTVINDEGAIIKPELWQQLTYNGRYVFKQDKMNANTFLIIRLSDTYYNEMVAKDAKPKESSFFKTGQRFSINETDINGNRFKSKDLKGKILVINYWFINCKPCRMEMPELNEIVKEYKDSANVKFIAIGLDGETEMQEFLKLVPFHYQIVANGRTATEKNGVTSYPTHVIVDGEGKVYFHTVGSPRQVFYWIRKSVNELLQHQRDMNRTIN